MPGLVRLAGHRMLVRRSVLEAWLDGHGVPETQPTEKTDEGLGTFLARATAGRRGPVRQG